MNKRDLIDAISGRLGDKKSATEAVNAVLETIQSAVANGDKVAITGFGVFEKAERPARTARNPATNQTIQVPASSVPKFRPGADFKALVNGEKPKKETESGRVTAAGGTRGSPGAPPAAASGDVHDHGRKPVR
jgi:DNA-binding protein HU-beta